MKQASTVTVETLTDDKQTCSVHANCTAQVRVTNQTYFVGYVCLPGFTVLMLQRDDKLQRRYERSQHDDG